MIKKICILLVIILMILITPKAYASNNVSIESITLKEKSEDLIELSKPTINGMNLGFNLSFLNIGDKAKYEVIISNNTNKDYYINNETKFNKSNYITYTYEFEGKVDKIKKNTKLKMYITIEYTTMVPPQKLVNGMYTEDNAMSMDLSDVILTNPSTYSNIIVFILIIITLLVLTIIQINRKQKIGVNLLLIGLLLIPITTYALEKITIKAQTKITIEEQRNIIESRYTSMSIAERDFWQYSNYIKTISFNTTIIEPNTFAYKFDVSDAKDNGILAYLVVNEEEPSYYDLYIMCNGYIYANPDTSEFLKLLKKLKTINNIEYFKTNFVTNMSHMFDGCSSLEEIDVSSFNTSNVTTMNNMFAQGLGSSGSNILKKINLGNIDTSNVTNMASMFNGCNFITELDVSHFNTSKVTDMSYMFYDCRNLESLDVRNFDVRNVENINRMFGNNMRIKELDLGNFEFTKDIIANDVLDNMNMLTRIRTPKTINNFNWRLPVSVFSDGNNNYISINNDTPTETWIYTITTLEFGSYFNNDIVRLAGGDRSNITKIERSYNKPDESNMLENNIVSANNSLGKVYAWFDSGTIYYYSESPIIYLHRETQYMFSELNELISVDLSGLDSRYLTDMTYMFYNCTKIQYIDLSEFDTSNLTKMFGTFSGCSNLELIYVSNKWNTDSVTNGALTFLNCNKLPNFDSSVIDYSKANTSDTGYLTLKS